jgi:hypothetical protein
MIQLLSGSICLCNTYSALEYSRFYPTQPFVTKICSTTAHQNVSGPVNEARLSEYLIVVTSLKSLKIVTSSRQFVYHDGADSVNVMVQEVGLFLTLLNLT